MPKTNNPLSGYFRAPKLYTKLPSGGRFYTDDVVDLSENKEVAVYALTAKDEAILKNPDAVSNEYVSSSVVIDSSAPSTLAIPVHSLPHVGHLPFTSISSP